MTLGPSITSSSNTNCSSEFLVSMLLPDSSSVLSLHGTRQLRSAKLACLFDVHKVM